MIRIAKEPFVAASEIAAFETRIGSAGAIVTFTGKVRDEAGGASVSALHLEHFPGQTEKSIADIENVAKRRWPLIDVLIIHRVGAMSAGEAIVLVCVASAHRRDAFEAADFLMDYLKTKALFWKKEVTSKGAVWIEPRKSDYEDAARWSEE